MDPLSPFKSASAFQSPWSTSTSSSPTSARSSSSPFNTSSGSGSTAQAPGSVNGKHRQTPSSGSIGTGTGTGYRTNPLPQSASYNGGIAGMVGSAGMAGMSSGAGAWGGEEVYNPSTPAQPGQGNGGVVYDAGGSGVASGSGSHMQQQQRQGQQQQPQQAQMYLRVKITGVERNRKDMLLRFDASTNLPNYRAGIYRNMQRSYAEFQRFAEQAQATSPQTIISALPLASSSALTDEEDDRLVRITLQRWLSRICEDPVLMRDEELRSFIESDFGYSPTPPPSARRPTGPSSAVPSVFTAALSKVVKRGPLEEDDELASAKAALEKLEITWAGAAAGVNALGKARRAYAAANQEVGGKLISLSTVESDFGLQGAERKVGRALETVAGVTGAQAASENIVLADTLGYQALNARAAKDALIQRTQLLEDSQTASKTAITKRRNVERLKGSSNINPAKVDDAIAEMEDANQLESTLSKQLTAISTNLHLSLRQHSRYTHEDAAMALLENARLSVGFQKQMLRELEIARSELGRVGSGDGYAGVRVGGKGQGAVQGMQGQMQGSQGAQSRVEGQRQGQSRSAEPTGPARYDGQTATIRPPPVLLPPGQSSSSTRPPPPSQGQHPGTQSMFLPSQQYPQHHPGQANGTPQAAMQAQQQDYQQNPQAQPGRPNDPLGGGAHPAHHMAQSMMVPPTHGQRPATVGRNGGKRLDERQAARMLAGGF